MQNINPNIVQYQEGYSVPSIRYQVILKKNSDIITEGGDSTISLDVSNRLINDINITEATDYRENLSYMSEVSLNLNNDDEQLSNASGNGFLDGENKIEVEIYSYFDIPNGIDYKLQKFGGYIDASKLKPNYVKKTIEVSCYSYLGELEKKSGKFLCTRYLDNHGLILYNIGIHLTKANIQNKVLKNGVHKIYSRIDSGNKQCKLNDGEWITLNNGLTELPNENDTQRVEVYYNTNSTFYDNKESLIIVKTEGEQYPYTLYYNVSVFELVKKCYNKIGLSDLFIQPYEIKTYDDRKIFSFYDIPFTDLEYSNINCLISDNDRYMYIAYKNQLWKRDMLLQVYQKIAEFEIDLEISRLLIDKNINTIFVWISLTTGSELEKLYKVDLNTDIKTLLFINGQSDLGVLSDIANAFQYSFLLQKFIFVWINNSNQKGISFLDLNGSIANIITDSNLVDYGFNIIWENSYNELYFYYLKYFNPSKLYRRKYNFDSQSFDNEEYKIDWFASQTGDIVAASGYIFKSENKIFVREYPNGDPIIYDLMNNVINPDINPNDYSLFSPIEWNNKLYLIAYKDNPKEQKICYIQNDIINLISENFSEYTFPSFGTRGDIQRLCITKNYKGYEIFNLAVLKPNMIIRWSEWFNLSIYGEVDFTENNLREVLNQLANTFLGFFKITPYKKAIFVGRNEYEVESTLTIKKEYIKERQTERIYNETYDAVKIDNGQVNEIWGTENIDSKILQITFKLLSNIILKDIAKYFYDYYSITRALIKIKYLPTFIEIETLDNVEILETNISGKLHKVVQKNNEIELEILV